MTAWNAKVIASQAVTTTSQQPRGVPRIEQLIAWALRAAAWLSVATTVGILAVLLWETAAFFSEVPWTAFLFDQQWTPLFADKHFGIWPLLCGTLLTSGIAMIVAVPFGLLAAIYLSEFASLRVRGIVKPTLELLAGIPTVVYGFFALIVITPFLQQIIPGLAGFNALSPGIVMGIMIIPLISSLSEEAIHAVPHSYKEGAYALGARRLTTIFSVILPAARSGIAASIVLALSRALGETMIVSIAAGQQPRLTTDPRVPIQTMTSYIVQISMGDTPAGTLEHRTIFAVGTMLFLLTFVMNVLSHRLARRFRRVN